MEGQSLADGGPLPSSPASLPTAIERPWLAHYSPGVPATIDIPDKPLPWLLDEATRRYGANLAVEYFGTRMSYLQLQTVRTTMVTAPARRSHCAASCASALQPALVSV